MDWIHWNSLGSDKKDIATLTVESRMFPGRFFGYRNLFDTLVIVFLLIVIVVHVIIFVHGPTSSVCGPSFATLSESRWHSPAPFVGHLLLLVLRVIWLLLLLLLLWWWWWWWWWWCSRRGCWSCGRRQCSRLSGFVQCFIPVYIGIIYNIRV